MAPGKEQLLDLYRQMVRIRTFEDRVAEIYWEDKLPAFDIGAGTIPGEMHLYQGQEAVAVGVCAHLRNEDFVASTHRGHGHLIAKKVDLKPMMAELMGRKTGLCQGKGGHMHLFSAELHYGCGGIIGGGIPHATGAALAFKKQKRDNVAVAFLGEGAANIGAFHESVNLAALWKLPVVFVVENNQWGLSTPAREQYACRHLADRGIGYGMPGIVVDGNDLLAVHRAVRRAAERARRGDGPTLLEFKTFRMRGHEEASGTAYVPKALFDSVQALADLPDGLEIHPAHGSVSVCGAGMSDRPMSTLGYERIANPYLRAGLDREGVPPLDSASASAYAEVP